jgi:hypothetical protein
MTPRLRFHHHHQVPVAGLNQWLRFYRPFTGLGIGVVIWRHEFSVTWRESHDTPD